MSLVAVCQADLRCYHASTRFHSIGCLVIQRQPSIPGRRRIVATSWPSPFGIFARQNLAELQLYNIDTALGRR